MYLYEYIFTCTVLYFTRLKSATMDPLHKQFSNEHRHILLFTKTHDDSQKTETCGGVTFQLTSCLFSCLQSTVYYQSLQYLVILLNVFLCTERLLYGECSRHWGSKETSFHLQ